MDVSKDLGLAQMSVIGAILLEPDVAERVVARVQPSDFTDPTLKTVYGVICKMFAAGKAIDPVLVHRGCGDGYFDTIRACMDNTPTATNVDYYADIVLEQGRLQRLGNLADKIKLAHTLDDARKHMDDANALMCDKPGLEIMTMAQGLTRFMERQTGKVKPDYVSWGFDQMDRGLYIQAGDFVILGGAPSSGKTALLIQWAVRQSRRKRVGFFSLETSTDKAYDRIMSHSAALPMQKIKTAALSDAELQHAAEVGAQLVSCGLEVIEAAGMTVGDIQATARSRHYDIIYVDYLQLVKAEGSSRYEQVTQISAGLHIMAQANKITVVALSQLSRGDKSGCDVPTMSSLRESGQIEQDADAVLLLHLQDATKPSGPRDLLIAKNKEGERGRIPLNFIGDIQTFRGYYEAPSAEPPQKKAKQSNRQVRFDELPGEPTPFDTKEA